MAAIAQTQYGKVEGLEQNGLAVFLGIPFAAPPVGAKRWRSPERPEPWSGVRTAQQVGAACPQLKVPLDTLSAFLIQEPQSEDCLYLNVWTPRADGARRPVLVWIHGGGFAIGSGAQAIYDGTALAKRGDVVVVTLNYRLGPLAFLRLSDLTGGRIAATGNEGILDQVFALEWVRENIAAFGGDPENVTIFGESAGGMSVGTLLGLPKARGLFHKAIAQSGASHTSNSLERANLIGERMLTALGAKSNDADALRAIPAAKLLGAVASLRTNLGAPDEQISGMPFQPVIDGVVQPRRAIESVAAGASTGLPLLVGSCLDEWRLFGPADPTLFSVAPDGVAAKLSSAIPAAARPRLVDAYKKARSERGAGVGGFDLCCAIEGDRVFRMPALQLLETQAAHERRVFSYLFTWRSPMMGGLLQSCHAIDLSFVFGTQTAPGQELFCGSGPNVDSLAETTMDTWLAFAKTGDPSCAAIGKLAPYSPVERATLVLGEKVSIERAPFEAERSAWSGVPDSAFGAF